MIEGSTARVLQLVSTSGLSQAKFAQKCEIAPSNFNRVVKSENDFSSQYLRRIAHAFGASYRWLSTGEGSMFEEPQGAGTACLSGKGMGNLIDDARAKTIMQQLGGHHNSQTAESAKEDRQAEIELLKKMVADKDKEIEFLRQMLAKTK